MSEIEEFDEEIAEAIYEQAKSHQLEQTLTLENIEEDESNLELSGFETISEEQAKTLKKNQIVTQEDLAELATDELREIIPISEETAGKIILSARKPWFDNINEEK